ncbi:Signal transduction histidine kinase [Nonomuraea solani]|uniref:histidine kinase n=1 Tax=Nonomuraea solani TaxID=1144553 RepID=A0A1H6EXU8_9ACTN|nr:histidine kinase [Nonomuraea solani]SEH02720.1 Signal transduction histidine kinase [Nonomuraea solani]
MAWFARVVAVVIADATLLWLDGMAFAGYAVLTALAMTAARRLPLAAFLAAVTMALFTGGSYALLVCTAYEAGQRISTRRDVVVIAGAVVAHLGVLLMAAERSLIADEPVGVLARVGVLTVLPVMAGRYLAQQRELTAARERLRIARDMHDSLGHLLSLVSVRAAELEVGPLPPEQRRAVRGLAGAARAAVAELHQVVGALRHTGGPGLADVDELVERFRAAGGEVTFERIGPAAPLTGESAYRVVQEGLTNAAKHAPGAPVRVSLDWQPDALLVTVVTPGARSGSAGGHGLAGLAERVREEGGLLRVHDEPHEFRLVAMLPVQVGAAA